MYTRVKTYTDSSSATFMSINQLIYINYIN